MKILQEHIAQQLEAIDFHQIARRTGFDNAHTKKITALSFLLGFFLLYNRGLSSLEEWAVCIGDVLGQLVSKQAVHLKSESRHAQCFEQTTRALLAQRLHEPALRSGLFAAFEHVLVEDSVLTALHRRLAQQFPSSHTRSGRAAATARTNWVYDLKHDQILDVRLGSYRTNDQGQAGCVLEVAQPGDLVLRDLGFFILSVFVQLNQRGISFVSRLRYGLKVYPEIGGEALDLVAWLRHHDRFDQWVYLGAEQPLRVRLVAVPLREEQVNNRRRKAKADRHSQAHHSRHYLESLAWNFYITNVDESIWTGEQVGQAYRFRWRIETFFKHLKSGLHTGAFLKRQMNYWRTRIVLWCVVLYLVLVVLPHFRFYLRYFLRQGRPVSLGRFIVWLRVHLEQVLTSESLEAFLPQIGHHCLYKPRKDRPNHYERLLET